VASLKKRKYSEEDMTLAREAKKLSFKLLRKLNKVYLNIKETGELDELYQENLDIFNKRWIDIRPLYNEKRALEEKEVKIKKEKEDIANQTDMIFDILESKSLI
jgi:hypothetical protein